MAMLKGIEAGVDGIDTALRPLLPKLPSCSGAFVVALKETPYDTGLISRHSKRSTTISRASYQIPAVFRHHQVLRHRHRRTHAPDPGGMISNLVSQLKQAKRCTGYTKCTKRFKDRADMGARRSSPDEPDRRCAGSHERDRRPVQVIRKK